MLVRLFACLCLLVFLCLILIVVGLILSFWLVYLRRLFGCVGFRNLQGSACCLLVALLFCVICVGFVTQVCIGWFGFGYLCFSVLLDLILHCDFCCGLIWV